MAYASQAGRARTSSTSPQAHAICDRCGFRWNFVDLRWQFDWRGASLQNLRILVCRRCQDIPQEQLRAIVLPADPVPIINARPEQFISDEVDFITISEPTVYDARTGIPIPSTTTINNPDGTPWTGIPVGAPLGYQQNAIMPLEGTTKYRQPVPVLSVTANGTTIISVTCYQAHGLATNAQISVEGLTNVRANGFYSITVTGGTVFTYTVSPIIPAGSLLGSNTLMVTANMGLPLDLAQIPLTGTSGTNSE